MSFEQSFYKWKFCSLTSEKFGYNCTKCIEWKEKCSSIEIVTHEKCLKSSCINF